MKKLPQIISAIVGVLLLLYLAFALSRCFQHHTLPPGYGLETNGSKWRYVDPDGRPDIFSFSLRQNAIEEAWNWFEYKCGQSTNAWRKVEP